MAIFIQPLSDLVFLVSYNTLLSSSTSSLCQAGQDILCDCPSELGTLFSFPLSWFISSEASKSFLSKDVSVTCYQFIFFPLFFLSSFLPIYFFPLYPKGSSGRGDKSICSLQSWSRGLFKFFFLKKIFSLTEML